jgi:hypothetical protein
MLEASKQTKLDVLLGDLTAWNDEVRQPARTYIDGQSTRYHRIWLADLAGHTELNDGWPTRGELLEVIYLVDPRALLQARHKLEAVRGYR